jgi:hypothetical protein
VIRGRQASNASGHERRTREVLESSELADVTLSPKPQTLWERYPGWWIVLLVDNAVHLLAFLTPDGNGGYQARLRRFGDPPPGDDP